MHQQTKNDIAWFGTSILAGIIAGLITWYCILPPLEKPQTFIFQAPSITGSSNRQSFKPIGAPLLSPVYRSNLELAHWAPAWN